MGWGCAMAGRGKGPRRGPLYPALWCPHAGGGEGIGGEEI